MTPREDDYEEDGGGNEKPSNGTATPFHGRSGQLRKSPWFTWEDIDPPDQDLVVTIEDVLQRDGVTYAGGRKADGVLSLKFAGFRRELHVNSTNRRVINDLFTDDVDQWRGKRIALFVQHGVKLGRKRVNAVRIRDRAPDAAPPSRSPVSRPQASASSPAAPASAPASATPASPRLVTDAQRSQMKDLLAKIEERGLAANLLDPSAATTAAAARAWCAGQGLDLRPVGAAIKAGTFTEEAAASAVAHLERILAAIPAPEREPGDDDAPPPVTEPAAQKPALAAMASDAALDARLDDLNL